MNYTPPEPFLLLDLQEQTIHWPIPTKIDVPMTVYIPPMKLYGESQLRAEVERVRRETIEDCAKVMDDMAEQDKRSNYYQVAARAIRGLLK